MESLYLNDETNTIKDTKWILLLWLWLLNIFSKYPQQKKKKKGNKVYIYIQSNLSIVVTWGRMTK